MSAFFRRRKFIDKYFPNASVALGDSVQISIPRDGYLSAIWIVLNVQVATAAATLAADGLSSVLKRVLMTLPSDQSRAVVNNVSGRALIELAANQGSFVDYDTFTNIGSSAAATYRFVYPIYFCPQQVKSPLEELFALDLLRHSQDPVLQLDFASQADMDTNGTPTFALGANKIFFDVVYEYFVPPQVYDVAKWELVESDAPFANSGRQYFEFPAGGLLPGVLVRSFTTASARGSITSANGNFSLEFSDVTFQKFKDQHLRSINDMSSFMGVSNKFAGSLYLDFQNDGIGAAVSLGGLFDLNPALGTSYRARLFQDITGGAAVRNKYTYQRVFGTQVDLLAKLR